MPFFANAFRRFSVLLGCLAFCWLSHGYMLATASQDIAQAKQETIRLQIRVIEKDGTPVPGADVQVWGDPTHETQSEPAWTRMAGQTFIDVPKNRERTLRITALAGEWLGGFANLSQSNADLDEIFEIKVDRFQKLKLTVLDYDTGLPISGCNVEVSMNEWANIPVDTGMKTVTESDGIAQFDRLIPGMHASIKATRVGYKQLHGPAPINSYDLWARNKRTTPVTLELITESSWNRILEAGRLSLPDIRNMSDDLALTTLTRHFRRNEERFKNRRTIVSDSNLGKVHRHYAYLQFPKAFYRDKIWKIAESASDNNVKLKALSWLIKEPQSDQPLYPSVRQSKVVERYVEQFSDHPEIASALSAIRAHHPSPTDALEKIASENPVRAIQAQAMRELVYSLSTRPVLYGDWTIPKDIKQRQLKERRFLQLLDDEYRDLPDIKQQELISNFVSRRLKWLDQYGIGGTPPNLIGKTLDDSKQVSLNKFTHKVIVLHFWSTSELPLFKDLEWINATFPDNVQVVGVAYGNLEKGQQQLAKRKTNWPMLWDPYQPVPFTVFDGSVNLSHPNGLSWGDQTLNSFKKFETIVIDQTGKIRSVGLKGADLRSHMEALVGKTK